MAYLETVGIDVSKKTIDVACHVLAKHEVFSNDLVGFNTMLKWIKSHNQTLKSILFCFEFTGIYSIHLSRFLSEKKYHFSIVSGLEMKRSGGIAGLRGKDDKSDAFRLAHYAYLRREELKSYVPPSDIIMKLRELHVLRERMVKHKSSFLQSLKEMKSLFKKKENPSFYSTQEYMIKQLKKQINLIEKEILFLIQSDEELNNLFTLIKTVKGVGNILGCYFIIVTHAFKRFENSRQFASYSGVAPFPNKSGSSLKGKTKTNSYGNRKIKALLHLAAMSAIQNDQEIKKYYSYRLSIGKNKMSTINIIRNKIIARVFAVVKRQTAFVQLAF